MQAKYTAVFPEPVMAVQQQACEFARCYGLANLAERFPSAPC